MAQKLELEIPEFSHWSEPNGFNWLAISAWRSEEKAPHQTIKMLWIESETVHELKYEYVVGLILAGKLQQVYKGKVEFTL